MCAINARSNRPCTLCEYKLEKRNMKYLMVKCCRRFMALSNVELVFSRHDDSFKYKNTFTYMPYMHLHTSHHTTNTTVRHVRERWCGICRIWIAYGIRGLFAKQAMVVFWAYIASSMYGRM